jgi:RHS repeat-associated protein
MYGSLAAANIYRFSSKDWNGNAGLYYYLYRFYDPNLQRWVNRDPIQERGGINLSRIVRNDPVDFRDYYGLIAPNVDCDALAEKIKDLQTLQKIANLTPYEDYELGNLLAQYAANCEDPHNKPPQFPMCPYTHPKPHPYQNNRGSFCSNHPWACGGIAVGIGVGIFCIAQPELCGVAIGITTTILRGAPVVAAGAAL